jgi:hypothetical protein
MNRVLFELLILDRIAVMKKVLVKVATETGINSEQTVIISQELDQLLNLHMNHISQTT